jgi:hypothetical protein
MEKSNMGKPEKQSGPHATGKDVSPTASRRDNHPGKKAGKAEHEKLIADQRIVADSSGDTFPKHSTAARKS